MMDWMIQYSRSVQYDIFPMARNIYAIIFVTAAQVHRANNFVIDVYSRCQIYAKFYLVAQLIILDLIEKSNLV